MINYDTIKSAYEDKLTLMQWLVKVQKALKDATAVSFNVNKRGDATLTFSILFDDGTELETDPIVIEQGESVESATLRNGHLILTLTNGDELDAGNMGAVSSFSINASQHLIVTYQDGSTNDLGAIFTGNVTISGDLTAINGIFHGSVKSTYYEPDTGNTLQFSGNLNCFDKIVDANGNPRFIGGDIATSNLANLVGNENVKYAKWSLSGTHIMIVLAFNAPANTMFTTGSYLASLTIPSWIGSQIQRIIPSSAMVAIEEVIGKQAGEVNIKKSFDLEKSSDSGFTIWAAENFTTTATNTGFRVQFDLLIE